MKNTGIFRHSSKTFSIGCCLDLVHQDSFGFLCAKNIFNYVKVRALCCSWKGSNLMDIQVNFGRSLFVRGCIDMWADVWLTLHVSIAFVP